MLVELLSDSSYVRYNIELANKLGLHEAIYLNVLIDINMKALKKDKVSKNADGEFFNVDRKYVKSITTFDVEEQSMIENSLKEAGIIDVKSQNKDKVQLCLRLNVITALFMQENQEIDEKLTKDLHKIMSSKSPQSKKSKSDFVIMNIIESLKPNNPELNSCGDLRDAMISWMNSVVLKRGWINRELTEIALHRLNEYTNRNLDMVLDILKIATANGWYNIDWAIKQYSEMIKTMSITDRQTSADTICEGRVYN